MEIYLILSIQVMVFLLTKGVIKVKNTVLN